jgi:hypothetical protein
MIPLIDNKTIEYLIARYNLDGKDVIIDKYIMIYAHLNANRNVLNIKDVGEASLVRLKNYLESTYNNKRK